MIDQRLLNIVSELSQVWATDDGHIIVRASFFLHGATTNALRIAPNGRLDTIRWEHSVVEDRSMFWKGPGWVIIGRTTPFAPAGVATFDPQGRAVVGGSRRSKWFVIAGGDTLQTVTLPDREIPVPPAIRDSVWSEYRAKLPDRPHIDDVIRKELLLTTLPPWVTFGIDRRGDWWIGRPGPNGALASWDVVRNGRIIAHVAVPTPVGAIKGTTGSPISFGRDIVAILHQDHSGAPWIGVYRIVRDLR